MENVREVENRDISLGNVMRILRNRVEYELDVTLDVEPKIESLECELADLLFATLSTFLDEHCIQTLETLDYDDGEEMDVPADLARDLANETLRDEQEGDSDCEDEMDESLYLPESDAVDNGKRKLTYEQEDKVIDYVRSKPSHGIKTLKQRFKFLKAVSDSFIYALKKRASDPTVESRRRKLTSLAEALHEQFDKVRGVELDHVDDQDLKEWALIFARDLQLTNFLASDTFILRWKKKHRIRSRKVTNFVTRRQIQSRQEKEGEAKTFGLAIKQITRTEKIEPKFIFNADQTGVPYELARNRTLDRIGQKYIFSKVKSKNEMMSSFTAMILITADGRVWPKTLLCLKEPTGRLGDRVAATVYRPKNIELTCTRSGKFTTSIFEYWVSTILTKAIPTSSKSLIMLDSWAPHKNVANFSSIEGRNYEVHVLPPGTTSLCQPLDVYFNRQFKDLMKFIHHQIRKRATIGGRLDRNVVICAVSMALFIMAAPRFQPMVRYAFVKSGVLNLPKEGFSRPLETCRILAATECDKEYCMSDASFLCPWCERTLCTFCMLGMDGYPHMRECRVYADSWDE